MPLPQNNTDGKNKKLRDICLLTEGYFSESILKHCQIPLNENTPNHNEIIRYRLKEKREKNATNLAAIKLEAAPR